MEAHGECEPGKVWIRFSPGAVSFDPEYDHGQNHFEVPIEEARFRDPALLGLLLEYDVETIATVAAGWRRIDPEDRFDRHGNPADLVDFIDTYRLTFDNFWDPEDLVEGLSRAPGVAHVECLPVIELQFTPNDEYYPNQWHLDNTGQEIGEEECDPAYDINAPAAWDLSDSAGTRIAILDDGIRANHEDLQGYIDVTLSNTWVRCKPDSPLLHWGDYGSHGTWVAGIAAAASDNEIGVAGIANLPPNAADSVLVALKFIHAFDGFTCTYAAIDHLGGALAYLANDIYPQALVANMSWGFPACLDQELGEEEEDPPVVIRDELRNAYLKDISLVAAGGNDANCGISGCGVGGKCVLYPAAYRDYALAVSAITCTGGWYKPAYQVTGNHIDVTAPGQGIYTTQISNGYGYADGTSMASPVASGIIALLLGKQPTLLNEDCYKILQMTAVDVGLGADSVGAGLVQADSALSLLSLPRKFGHGTWTTYSSTKVDERWIETKNVPGINPQPEQYDSVWVHAYEITSSGSLKNPFTVPAVWDTAWARERVTTGWRNIDASLNYRYDALRHAKRAEFTDLDLEDGTGTMRTFTYLAFADDTEADTLCWHPFRPVSATDTCEPTGSFAISHSVVARADISQGRTAGPAGGIRSLQRRGADGATLELVLDSSGTYSFRIFDVGAVRFVRSLRGELLLPAGT